MLLTTCTHGGLLNSIIANAVLYLLHLHNFTYVVGLDELLLYTIYIGQLMYRMAGKLIYNLDNLYIMYYSMHMQD